MAGVAISGTEDEDLAEYVDGHEDAGELLTLLLTVRRLRRRRRAEITRPLAEFGVYESVDLHVALGKKRVTTHWDLDRRKDGIRIRFVPREFECDETMHDVFAPSSTPSTGRVIDHLSLKKSHHTFTADVRNAYFHVDEDEECYADPRPEWLEQHAALGQT